MKRKQTLSVQRAHGTLPLALRILLGLTLPVVSLAPMGAMAAEDPTVEELTTPRSTVEVGVGSVSDSSAAFGQYNGLNKKGTKGNGGFDLRGGGRYDSGDATRWSATGTNLGLDTREMRVEYGVQGQFRITAGYNEIVNNKSDSYQTPYLGIGTNVLTLPTLGNTGGWNGTPNPAVPQQSSNANTTAANNMQRMSDAAKATFREVDLGVQRKVYDLSAVNLVDAQWTVNAGVRREEKTGLKALGAPIVGSKSVILPQPINTETNQFNLSLNRKLDKGFVEFGYNGSLFRDKYSSLTFDNAFYTGGAAILTSAGASTSTSAPAVGAMALEPNNQFHQFSVNGAQVVSPTLRWSGGLSYSRNSQNQAYLPYNTYGSIDATKGNGALPASSFNGLVETTSLNFRAINKPREDLQFTYNLKYDDRENRSPSLLYNYLDVDKFGATNTSHYNTPYSRRTLVMNFDGDYKLGNGRSVKAGVDYHDVERWCNNMTAPAFTGSAPAMDCNEASATRNTTFRLEHRQRVDEDLQHRVSVQFSERRSTGSVNTTGATIAGTKYYANVGTYYSPYQYAQPNPGGFGSYNMANRNRSKLRGALDWQLSDAASLTATLDYNADEYPTSTFGVRGANSIAPSLDLAVTASEDVSFNGFVTLEKNLSQMAGVQTASTLTNRWAVDLYDYAVTSGVGAKARNLGPGGKLDVDSNVVVVRSQSPMELFGTYTASGKTPTEYGALPTPYVQTLQFRFNGRYNIDKSQALRATYMYARLRSSDYAYAGMQFYANSAAGSSPTANNSYNYPGLTGVMPTNETAPNYNLHAVGVYYSYSF